MRCPTATLKETRSDGTEVFEYTEDGVVKTFEVPDGSFYICWRGEWIVAHVPSQI